MTSVRVPNAELVRLDAWCTEQEVPSRTRGLVALIRSIGRKGTPARRVIDAEARILELEELLLESTRMRQDVSQERDVEKMKNRQVRDQMQAYTHRIKAAGLAPAQLRKIFGTE